MTDFSRAEVCTVAVAEAFRGDGEILDLDLDGSRAGYENRQANGGCPGDA